MGFYSCGAVHRGRGVGVELGKPLAGSAVEQRAAMPLGQTREEMVERRATSSFESSPSATSVGCSTERDATMGQGE